MNGKIDNKELIKLFKRLVPHNNMTDKQINLYLLYVLNKFNMDLLKNEEGKICLQIKEVEKFTRIANSIEDVIINPENYYTITDLCKIFSLGKSRIRTLANRGRFIIEAYILAGPHYVRYFSKAKVDKIIRFLNETVTLTETVDIINSNFGYDLNYCEVKDYVNKKEIKKSINPIKESEVRLYRKDISIFSEYPIMEFNPDLYYTVSQITEKFNVTTYSRTFEGRINDKHLFKNSWYFSKKEVDDIMYLKDNSITVNEACEQLNINKETLRKKLSQYGLEYSSGRENIFKYSMISNENYDKFLEFYYKELEYNSLETDYEKLLYNISKSQDNENAIKTKELFLKNVINRFNNHRQKNNLLIPLIQIYNEILLKVDKEIYLMNDKEIIKLISKLNNQSNKTREEFIRFLDYISTKEEVRYKDNFKYTGRQNKSKRKRISNSYKYEQWIEFGKLIFLNIDNEQYLEKALNIRMDSMVWLYCALHYCSSWRKADYINKIPKIDLKTIINIESEDFINWIKEENVFTEEMGQAVCNYVIMELNMFDKKASKNNQRLKLDIGSSLVRPIGFLLALSESHRKINELEPSYYHYLTDTILTNSCSYRKNHIEFFGEDYNKIFKKETFNNLKATSTYLQNIVIKSNEFNWNIGYYLASVSRGHSSNKFEIAQTTQVYLSDINKDNDLDIISFNLYERGEFGFILYKLLSIINGEDFKKLNIEDQTKAIKDLSPITPSYIESINRRINEQQNAIDEIIGNIISKEEDVAELLKKVSLGELPSKMENSQCLLKINGKNKCKYPIKDDCIGCYFLIPEMYFLLKVNKMLNNLLVNISTSDLEFDKLRLGSILTNSYLPLLNEAVIFWGYERVNTFINISNLKNKLKELMINGKYIVR